VPLAGALPASMWGIFAGGMEWLNASRGVHRNRKRVWIRLLQQKVE